MQPAGLCRKEMSCHCVSRIAAKNNRATDPRMHSVSRISRPYLVRLLTTRPILPTQNIFRMVTNGDSNGHTVSNKTSSGPLKVKRLSENAYLPSRGSKFAAGYDLYSAYDCTVPARGKNLIKTDISIAFPDGLYARVAPRSGLAWKNSIDVGAGVIDVDYRGNVGVILFNHSDEEFKIVRGDRVAQLILEHIHTPEVLEVEDLDETERNAGGFGSTGVSIQTSNGDNKRSKTDE